jgi:hypothetical protein
MGMCRPLDALDVMLDTPSPWAALPTAGSWMPAIFSSLISNNSSKNNHNYGNRNISLLNLGDIMAKAVVTFLANMESLSIRAEPLDPPN